MLIALSVLLSLSWAMSLAFAFTVGVGMGHKQAHDRRTQFVETARDGVLAIIERVKHDPAKPDPITAAAIKVRNDLAAQINAHLRYGDGGPDRHGAGVPAQETQG